MGQWATRRRRGGGPPGGGAPLIQIVSVTLFSLNVMTVTYSAPITAALFSLADFKTNPSLFAPSSIAQAAPNKLNLAFGADIDTEASLTYTGAVPGVASPETVNIT